MRNAREILKLKILMSMLPRNLAVRWTDTAAYLESSDGHVLVQTRDSEKGKTLEAIAHAANAYPKLVEALRDVVRQVKAYPEQHAAVTALLRELGEIE